MTTPAAPTGSGGVGTEQSDATAHHHSRPSGCLDRVTPPPLVTEVEHVTTILKRVVSRLIEDNPGLAKYVGGPDTEGAE